MTSISDHPERIVISRNGAAPKFDSDRHTCLNNSARLFSVSLIDTRTLLGEVLLKALKEVDAAAEYTLFPSVASWLNSANINNHHIVLLSLDPQPGRTVDVCTRDLQTLRHAAPNTPVIVLSSEESPDSVQRALDMGAGGYACTNLKVPAMVRIIRLVQAGETYVPAASFRALIQRPVGNAGEGAEQETLLSHREMLVAKALRKGTPNKVIAYELNMCESTVKVHVRNIMKKVKAKNRTQVAFLTNDMFSD